MDNPICPACRRENAEDAAFCDQCGQPLKSPQADGDVPESGGCPACGGRVQSRGDGKGVCQSCGLELFETSDAPAVPKLSGDAVERLIEAILQKTAAGLGLNKAVAEACREIFPPSVDAPASDAASAGDEKSEPCPLCGAAAPLSAPRCTGCGLWFQALRKPQPCPRCERLVAGGKCECGAILTLPALLEYIEPTVKFVCSGCKQPYAVLQSKCPDCGGGLISADRIKAFAASGS
jgi:predicted amidophosphoribosyltransferase